MGSALAYQKFLDRTGALIVEDMGMWRVSLGFQIDLDTGEGTTHAVILSWLNES